MFPVFPNDAINLVVHWWGQSPSDPITQNDLDSPSGDQVFDA